MYLGFKGDQFFSDLRNLFWRSFYVQIGLLQFVVYCSTGVRIYAKLYAKNVYATNLY
jgi:hypothetical protein